MSQHEKLNYVEFPAKDIPATKQFFEQAFGWSFKDFGSDYTAFSAQGLEGGFYKSDLSATIDKGAALLVLLSENLEFTQSKVTSADAKISQSIFDFPGGRRFYFIEPSGNELAVWQKIST
jgi:predicted enzyme related to lactoylglutathione lyase